MVVEALNVASVVFGSVAAVLWVVSATVRVKPDPDNTDFRIVDEDEGREDVDVLETIKRGATHNARAAIMTAVAMACQASSLLIQALA